MQQHWSKKMIDDWHFTAEQMMFKAGGVGKLKKAECHLFKSLEVGSLSLFLGIDGIYAGCLLIRGLCKYSQVYNIDTNIYGKSSTCLFMKALPGVDDDEIYAFGPKLCLTTGRCGNIIGARHVIHIFVFCFVFAFVLVVCFCKQKIETPVFAVI